MARFILSAFADEANPNLDEQINALQRNEIEYIEIRGVVDRNIIKHDDNRIKEIKAKLEAGGIKVWSIGSTIGKIGIKDDFEPHFKISRGLLKLHKCLIAITYAYLAFHAWRREP